MTKVAIVTDSTTNLPEEMMTKYGVHSAPATIIWPGEELRDGIDIQPDDFYARLETSKEIPSTSQASPATFKAIYDELVAKGHDILSLVISQKLSGTYASALQAKEMLPEAQIEVVDSGTGAMALGWVIERVAEAAKAGADLIACKKMALNALKNTGILLMVDTLEYLHRGGRIGGAQRFLGTALNFKPILEVVDGVFEGLERVRTHEKALKRMVELVKERIDDRTPVHLAALHANAASTAERLLEQAKSTVQVAKSMISGVSPAVGTHLGPGTVGLAFLAGED